MIKDMNKKNNIKIAVVGTGYVGLSMATLLSQKYEVIAYNRHSDKCNKINKRISLIHDSDIEYYFKNKSLNLKATTSYKKAFKDAKYIIIAVPTNYDENTSYFDCSAIEENIIKILEVNNDCTIVIKSTIPIGYTESIKEKYNIDKIIFSPEFLREGKSLYDNLYPSRIIVSPDEEYSKEFALILKSCSLKESIDIKYLNYKEAESIKLFSNSYLALRISFFNELDTFCELNNLNAENIISGICLDSRIGSYYNNPSFGYGGYCLIKDTKQLYSNFNSDLIKSIINSNDIRKNHITKMILNKNMNVIGVYRLVMKKDSDNFKNCAVNGIIERLKKNNITVIIYEPLLNDKKYNDCDVINDFKLFCTKSELIIANRMDDELNIVRDKVYTRDIFNNN